MKSTKYYPNQELDTHHFNYIKVVQKNKIQTFEPKNKKQLLCKISFEIDGEQEELFIYQNTTLDQITDQLIQKIINNEQEEDSVEEKVSLEQKKALKDQIKSKIQMIIECCIEKNAKTQKWKKKLKQIIQQKSMTPIECLSQYGTKRCQQRNSSTSIKYFNYKFFNNQSQKDVTSLDLNGEQKSIEIINRAKQIQSILSNTLQKREINQHSNRLYQLSKRNETIRSEVTRMREQLQERQMFSECTFHPNVHRLHFNKQHKPALREEKSQSQSVFKRLYKGALEKQEMSKIIEKQINEKQQQQIKKYNFIPKINQCSNQIATLKKKIHQKHGLSIYQSLYQEGNKKAKELYRNNNLTFHPKLCQKSEKLIQQSRSTKNMLKKIFSPKQKTILKTQACDDDQKPSINYYQKITSSKQNRNKNAQRFLINKQNINEQLSLCKIHRNKNVNSFHGSKKIINRDHLETNSSVLSFSTNSKTARQKEPNFHTLINQNSSKKKEAQQSYTVNKRSQQLSGKLESLQNIGQRCLGELDINKLKNEEKEQKRRQRLNPFQFFKLVDSKKQKNNKKTVTQQDIQRKKPTYNQIPKQTKSKIFSNIFKLLNSISGEEIYYESIYKCQAIPVHLKKILYPMAQEMQQLNVGLDQQEFIWSLTRICQNLPQKDQGQIIEWSEHLNFNQNIAP